MNNFGIVAATMLSVWLLVSGWLKSYAAPDKLLQTSTKPISAARKAPKKFESNYMFHNFAPNQPNGLIIKQSAAPTNTIASTSNRPTPTNPNKRQKSIKLNLHNASTKQLWQHWQLLVNQSQLQQIPIMNVLLSERLRKTPSPDIYLDINHAFSQVDITIKTKALLIDLLAEIATPESLRQLIALSEQGTDSQFYLLVLDGISRIGENRWEGKFHEELSPILEPIWSDPSKSEQSFVNAIGKAIADVGAPSGVSLLLQTLTIKPYQLESVDTDQTRAIVAFNNIPHVRNPAAIPTLSDSLHHDPIGSPTFEASGTALSEMSTTQASQEIADWAHQAPASGAKNLEEWGNTINNNGTLYPLIESQSQPFQSPEMQDVINRIGTSTYNSDEPISNASVIALP